MAEIPLNLMQIKKVKNLAKEISDNVQKIIVKKSSVSVERTVLRLYGVDGVNSDKTPLVNRVVDILKEKKLLKNGVSKYFAAAMLESGRDAKTTAELIDQGKIEFGNFDKFSFDQISEMEKKLTALAIEVIDSSRKRKKIKQEKTPLPPQPYKYMIVATGNIYEDRTQAEAAVLAGSDIIAVIRSTAQSLLDYVPYGATTEGFGGTFATQENFKVMREALDKASERSGRYIRLVNYASGLCMAEIAACAAFEDLDMLLNDSMYGILFRDINKIRTFVDQHFSRLICARAGIVINTGEDNYLTTSDAVDNAFTVTASQLINEAMGKNSNLTDDLLAVSLIEGSPA